MISPHDDPDARPEELARLRATPMMPDQLEDRVVASLRGAGLLTPGAGQRRRSWRPTAALLAASLACFWIGRITGGSGQAPADSPVGARWMLLLYEDHSFKGPTPGREHEYVEEYRQWAEAGHAAGTVLDGAELIPGAALLAPDQPADPMPVSLELSGAGRLSGYFVILAPTLEEAAAIARTSPHLRHHGRIAIAPIGAS